MPSNRSTSFASGGFSLVELIIAAALLAIAGSAAGIMVTMSNRSTVRTATLATTSAAIDSDISRIKRLSETYTCCLGSPNPCSSNPTTIAASANCQGVVGDSSYYFPKATATAAITTFEGLCANGLTTQLRTDIDALPQTSGALRAAAVLDDAASHRILISYAGSGISRVVKIVPVVAGWCR